MPDFQNPTGNSLDRAEREALLDAAAALDVPLVEDAAYEALRYDGEALPALLALVSQMVMHEVVQETLPQALGEIRRAYRARRDAMLAALAAEMPPGVAWTRPQGGMFIWLTLPAAIDAAGLLQRAIAEARVAFVPGRAFHADGSGANTLRLNFSLADAPRIKDGVARLGALLRRY